LRGLVGYRSGQVINPRYLCSAAQFEKRPNESDYYMMKSTSAGPQKSGPWAAGNRAGVIVLQQLASTNQNNDQPVVAAGVFRPIDTARIARELRIEAVARDRGRHNLPETGDNNLDGLEQKIIQTIDGERAWQGRELLNSLRAYAAQVVSYSVPEEFPKLQIHAKHALASLSVAAGRAPNDLLPLQKRYVAARDALEEFRSRNHLSRSARDPARGWSTLGLLFIFVAMESMLTGFFSRTAVNLALWMRSEWRLKFR
jgi:hypothetical protein